jgi:hypothetical protein
LIKLPIIISTGIVIYHMEVENMIKQCAWCESLTVAGLKITEPLPRKNGYSHGICLACKGEFLNKKDETNTVIWEYLSKLTA